jgi:hypothetical protein
MMVMTIDDVRLLAVRFVCRRLVRVCVWRQRRLLSRHSIRWCQSTASADNIALLHVCHTVVVIIIVAVLLMYYCTAHAPLSSAQLSLAQLLLSAAFAVVIVIIVCRCYSATATDSSALGYFNRPPLGYSLGHFDWAWLMKYIAVNHLI